VTFPSTSIRKSVIAIAGPSPVVPVRKSMTCPDCSPPRTHEHNTALCERALEAEIAHDRSDDRIPGELARVVQLAADCVHDVIAAHDLAALVHEQRAIRVSVERDADDAALASLEPGANRG
jgi:hypothetical protein